MNNERLGRIRAALESQAWVTHYYNPRIYTKKGRKNVDVLKLMEMSDSHITAFLCEDAEMDRADSVETPAPPLTQEQQTDRFFEEVEKLVVRYAGEYDLTYASAVGVLHLVAAKLTQDALRPEDGE